MQDLASEFSKNFPGVIPPDPHSGRGRLSPAPNTQPGFWQGVGRERPGVGLGLGPQALVPLNFSGVVAPLPDRRQRAEKVCRVQGEHVEFLLTYRSVL